MNRMACLPIHPLIPLTIPPPLLQSSDVSAHRAPRWRLFLPCQPLPELYLNLSPLPQGLSQKQRVCVHSPRPQVVHLGDQPVERESRDLRTSCAWAMSTVRQSRHLSSGIEMRVKCHSAGTPRGQKANANGLTVGVQKSECLSIDGQGKHQRFKKLKFEAKIFRPSGG